MRIIEQYTEGKMPGTPSEDLITTLMKSDGEGLLLTAVIDGATPKNSYRLPDGETPGHFASHTIAEAVQMLPQRSNGLDPTEAVRFISERLRHSIRPEMRQAPDFTPPTASMVMLDVIGRQVIQVGDCPFAFVLTDGTIIEHRNEKLIDHILSDWRSSIIGSYLSRGLMTPAQIATHDPGRAVIQPFITRQVIWQNADPTNPYSFGVIDGSPVPVEFIKVYPIPSCTSEVILASDGFPRLFRTLAKSLQHLHDSIATDPLCTGHLRGTKGLRPDAKYPDDVSYMRIGFQFSRPK